MRSKHCPAILLFLVALGATGLTERTFAEDSIVVNTRALAAGSSATLLVRAFAGENELGVATNPVTVSVYLDRRLAGTAPYQQSAIAAGSWLIGVEAPGYDSKEIQVGIEDAISYEVIFHLARTTGKLMVKLQPEDAQLFVDGRPAHPGLLSLPTGFRNLSVRRFGYDDLSTSVLVPERGIAAVNLVLKPAVFSASRYSATRAIFNPANAGPFGETRFSFLVNAPGSGRLSIVDESGERVFSHDFPAFESWEQSLLWNGRDAEGKPLPDGSYTATLQTTSAAGISSESSLDLQIDSSLVARPLGESEGLAGLSLLPIPLASPQGLGGFDVAAESDFSTGLLRLTAGAQVGLGPVVVGFEASGDFENSGSFDFGLNLPLPTIGIFGPGFGASLALGTDSSGLFRGRANLVLPLYSGLGGDGEPGMPAFFIGLSPLAEVSGNVALAAPQFETGLAGGFLVASDTWLIGLSARASSSDLLAGIPAFGGIEAALETRFLIFGGPLLLSIGCGGTMGADVVTSLPWMKAGIGLWF